MAGLEYNKEKPVEKAIPFKDVYFTGMVRDKQGRKMSKQLGNSPDLLHLIEEYGADAVRFGIMISSPAGNDLLFDNASLDQGKFFNNKLWNALKLVKMWEKKVDPSLPVADQFALQWFESRLSEVKTEVEKLFAEFRLSEALKTIYSLIWDDFCSWYLEWVKPGFDQPISADVYNKTVAYFTELLQLLHPYMPFISEEIYHLLEERKEDLCVKQFKSACIVNNEILKQGAILKADITAIRDARKKNEIKNSERISFQKNGTGDRIYRDEKGIGMDRLLRKQTNVYFDDSVYFNEDYTVGDKERIVVSSADRQFYLYVDKKIDTSAQKEQLEKDLAYQKGFLTSIAKKLSNERFVQNAKPEVVELERKKMTDAEAKIKAIEESLAQLVG